MPRKKNPEHAPSVDAEREHLARKLKEAREYLGLSQDYVSQQTRIPRPAISEVEAGRRKVESLELKRLAALYGRPLNYFLPENQGADADRSAEAARMNGNDQIVTKLRNLTRDLPAEDREEIIRFAEYLRHRKQAPRVTGHDGEDENP